MPRSFRFVAALLAIALLGAAAPPRRIVSLNMCADQLVIALADRSQIAGVTEWARDPQLSYYADRARGLPITHRSAEEVLTLHPDLLIGAPYRAEAMLKSLKTRNIRMIDMPEATDFEGIQAALRTIGAAVGHPDRAEALIGGMKRDLAAIGPMPGRGRVAAFYQRQGYLTGTGTLVDDMMRRVGLINLASRLDLPVLARVSLERMALARPDFLVMDEGTRIVGDRGSAMLHHPLLDRVVPPRRRLYIPQSLTVCGTPGYSKAVALLAGQIRDEAISR